MIFKFLVVGLLKKICMVIFVVLYDRNYKDIYIDDVSVNYWFGFVVYMKIILLMYCNDKSKNIIKY